MTAIRFRSFFSHVLPAVSLAWALSAGAADLTRPAEFTVVGTSVITNPPGFGAEYVHQQRINNWARYPGMEPLLIERYWELSGGGSDTNGDYAVCNTRLWDTLSSGFLDGAHYRLYREGTSGIQKLREGIIPPGGYVARGFEQVTTSGIVGIPPNTTATDTYRITNGETWYYAVRARDTLGNYSDYGVTATGVTPQAGLTNGPRIITATVPNAEVGRTYTIASPLTRLTATGAVPPLTWTVVSNALPAGLQLVSTNGAIIGTSSSSNQTVFTVQVQDGMSRTHRRTYTMYRQRPTGISGAPAAPSNVTVEANDGFVYVTWDPVADTDIDYYVISRSRWPQSQHMERIYLGTGGPVPAANDLLFVEKLATNAPPPETRSLRILELQSDNIWGNSGVGFQQEFVKHPGPIPTAFSNEYPGATCLKLSSTNSGEFTISQYKYAATNDTWWGVEQLPANRTYRFECWVYGQNLASNTVRFRSSPYVDVTVTGIVNGAWTKLGTTFTVNNWLTSPMAVSGPNLSFRGPGTAYVDNVVLYDINEPRGPTKLTQPIMDMWQSYTGPTNATGKGVVRVRFMDVPFAHAISPSVMSYRNWDLNRGARELEDMHIHEALQVAYESGTSPATRNIPWITASLQWSEQEYLDLMEYLAGPAGTPYGDLRIALRGGITTPWTEEFRHIIIEMGNEPWNSGYFFAFRGGFSQTSGRTYGRWCQYIWNHVKTNSPYGSTVGNKIKISLGGWAASLADSGFTVAAREECPLASYVGLTTYLGGWEANDPVGGIVWNDEGVQQWMVYNDRSGQKYIEDVVAMRQRLDGRGMPTDIVMYEGGPSYLASGLNGVSLTPAEQEVARNYGRTFAAGIGTLDFWLYASLRGIREQSYFTFSQDKGLWASHTPVWTGYRPHPSWQVLEMINRYVGDVPLLVTATQQVPTYDLSYTNNSGQLIIKSNMMLVATYAFGRDGKCAVAVINKKLDGVHDGLDFGTGHVPVTLHLPFSNPTNITLYTLSGNPRLTNRDALNFAIQQQTLSPAVFSKNFVINETTGGATNGMPTGVYLYVFDGATFDPLPTRPQVTINQAPLQPDPVSLTSTNAVQFLAVFDRPVTGFGDSPGDVLLGGTALPQSFTATEVPGSTGCVYLVTVTGMQKFGTVTAMVAENAASGNELSTSADNTVTITGTVTNPLAPANVQFTVDAANNRIFATWEVAPGTTPATYPDSWTVSYGNSPNGPYTTVPGLTTPQYTITGMPLYVRIDSVNGAGSAGHEYSVLDKPEDFTGVPVGQIPSGWERVRNPSIGVAVPDNPALMTSPTGTPLLRHYDWTMHGMLIFTNHPGLQYHTVRGVLARGGSNNNDNNGIVIMYNDTNNYLRVTIGASDDVTVTCQGGGWSKSLDLIDDPGDPDNATAMDHGEFWTFIVTVLPAAQPGKIDILVQIYDQTGTSRIDPAKAGEMIGNAWVLRNQTPPAAGIRGAYGTYSSIAMGGTPNTGMWFDSITSRPVGNYGYDAPPNLTNVVTVSATVGSTTEGATNAPAVFTVTRTGSTLSNLVVNYTLSGTASNGMDYTTLTSPATIPSNATSTTIMVLPVADDWVEGTETVVLTLQPGSGYNLGVPTNATVNILDRPIDQWRLTKFGANANTPSIAGDVADPDGDGLPNLLEYALNREPLLSDAAGAVNTTNLAGYLALVYTRADPPPPDILYGAGTSSNLVDWCFEPSCTVTQGVRGSGMETITVRDTVPIESARSRFLRLRITR